ncbi:hypothetical protein H2200_009079 [Cladophialophora chaetospira]|uniref:BZIP domain-containing protein n=1 Tax=Cladophialophora chaetospira TaxID=386627 RepID=A0AA38X3Q3_9EURO|nr:hypothetical protein H2200_009079 [Cladophialophora chaetospira]
MSTFQHNSWIQVRPMPQLAEAVDREDDWTGVTSATERRRRQNRLNSRAFRRRRAREEQECLKGDLPRSTTAHGTALEHEATIPCWSEASQAIILVPISHLPSHLWYSKMPLLPYTTTPVKLNRVIFPLSSDHLITLLQYNVLRACLINRDLVAKLQPREGGEEWSSTALTILPNVDSSFLSQLLPPSLHPTLLQKTVLHAAWIDILPHPVLRDNLILLTTPVHVQPSSCKTTPFDEDALWTDSVGGLFKGSSPTQANYTGGIVWASPWDVSGWEMSEAFWRKYRSIFRGCEDEVLSATNRWRRKRGESDLAQE